MRGLHNLLSTITLAQINSLFCHSNLILRTTVETATRFLIWEGIILHFRVRFDSTMMILLDQMEENLILDNFVTIIFSLIRPAPKDRVENE